MMSLAQELWPINRSLSGQGLRDTLSILSTYLPDVQVKSINSGTKVYDWTVPKEWEVTAA
jgi:aminopeptidase-like protein